MNTGLPGRRAQCLLWEAGWEDSSKETGTNRQWTESAGDQEQFSFRNAGAVPVQRQYLAIFYGSFRGRSGQASSPYLHGQTRTLSLESHCPMHGKWKLSCLILQCLHSSHTCILLRYVTELKAWESLNKVLNFWQHSGFKRRVIGDLGDFTLISL